MTSPASRLWILNQISRKKSNNDGMWKTWKLRIGTITVVTVNKRVELEKLNWKEKNLFIHVGSSEY
jgi:hypothetical protein